MYCVISAYWTCSRGDFFFKGLSAINWNQCKGKDTYTISIKSSKRLTELKEKKKKKCTIWKTLPPFFPFHPLSPKNRQLLTYANSQWRIALCLILTSNLCIKVIFPSFGERYIPTVLFQSIHEEVQKMRQR